MLLNNAQISEWLSKEEQLLLRAALLDGDEALSAWKSWRENVDTDKINYHSMRLIPLLYNNLCRLGLQAELPDQLNGVRRYFWAYNQLTFNYVQPALKLLVDNNIEIMILKGGALVTSYYESVGLRPMRDVDLLIKPEDAQRAIKLLHGLPEWNIYSSLSTVNSETYVSTANELHFISDNWQYNIDLHWNLTHRLLGKECEKELWDSSEKATFLGLAVSIPCPTDLLLHVCLHSLTFRFESEPYWVADALTIMSKGKIDWDRLEKLSIKYRYRLEVLTALRFINSFQPDAGLSQFLVNVEDYKPTLIEKLQYHIGISPKNYSSRLLFIWVRYYWYRTSQPPGGKPASFRKYFKITHFLNDRENIFAYMFKRSINGIKSKKKIQDLEPSH